MTADLIQQPHLWQLLMEASSTGLAVMAYSPYEGHNLIYRVLDYATKSGELQGLENTVYDNPLLLADFRKVTLLYDSPHVLPVPDTADELAEAIFRNVYPDYGRHTKVLVSHIPEMDIALCSEIPAETDNFLRRTFPCITIEHPLAPLCRYFRAKHPTRRRGKTLVNIHGSRLDIITLGDNAPMALSTHHIEAPMDAVYYILASRSKLSLPATDEIMIAGDRTVRAAITPVLRRYVRYVMPAIFPSVMLHAGRESLSAPFELIVAPLTPATTHAGANMADRTNQPTQPCE